MRKAVFIGLALLVVFAVNGYSQKDKSRIRLKQDSVVVDSIKYELFVIDPGFDGWLATKPRKEFYSKYYYEGKNRMFVVEWNNRYLNQSRYGYLYETYIDYDPRTDYGLDLNYRLYYYFLYFEETNHVKLLPGGR
jgi:hypothetical protein